MRLYPQAANLAFTAAAVLSPPLPQELCPVGFHGHHSSVISSLKILSTPTGSLFLHLAVFHCHSSAIASTPAGALPCPQPTTAKAYPSSAVSIELQSDSKRYSRLRNYSSLIFLSRLTHPMSYCNLVRSYESKSFCSSFKEAV